MGVYNLPDLRDQLDWEENRKRERSKRISRGIESVLMMFFVYSFLLLLSFAVVAVANYIR